MQIAMPPHRRRHCCGHLGSRARSTIFERADRHRFRRDAVVIVIEHLFMQSSPVVVSPSAAG
ncbi:hypothetical protein ACFXPS_03430 [Nocardia sp. NPDC059091]|uniref:hypothetical protein n=1 Tax=unclassified Nocardia TaxID=2637762 RepID=UPI0036B24211